MTDAPHPVLEAINRLSSADEIFDFLGLDHDPTVVSVSRLHIMKRFGAYLRELDIGGLSDEAARDACRGQLARAYLDFVESTPLREKVFKVFRDEEAKRAARFVSIDTLTIAAG